MFEKVFEQEGRRLVFNGSGIVTGEELVRSKDDLLLSEPAVRRIREALILLIDVTEFRVSAEDIRAVAEIDKQLARWAPDVAIAVVAPRDHVFGMARMWSTIAEETGWRSGIFRATREAEDWLRTLPKINPA